MPRWICTLYFAVFVNGILKTGSYFILEVGGLTLFPSFL